MPNTSIQIQVHVNSPINKDEIYKYDPSSYYYNDLCSTSTSKNGTDIILSDRQNEYVNNNLLCENDCTFSGYNPDTKKAKCECKVKTKISELTNLKIDKEKFFDGFIDLKSLININVMKCFKLLFSDD